MENQTQKFYSIPLFFPAFRLRLRSENRAQNVAFKHKSKTMDGPYVSFIIRIVANNFEI